MSPCRPGPTPVIKEVQAGYVDGGRVDRAIPNVPRSIREVIWGRRPVADQGSIRSNVPASIPIIRSRLVGGVLFLFGNDF